ncbi:MAG: nucleotidyltransferase domain-containing protein [Clostridiales bacterium]|jgi:predicted nucleotidyltransferase|nr:nucleotidyltransferase domain-containing protein [Clostridiales bacterium]
MKLNKFGLPDYVMDEIIKTLRKFPEIKSAKIFGSRAKGNHDRYSDVDIAVFAEGDWLFAAEVKRRWKIWT